MTRAGADRIEPERVAPEAGTRHPARRGLWIVVTHGTTARLLLRGQLGYLRRSGFAVTLVGSPGPELDAAARSEEVRALGVPMRREISPLRDLVSLWRLIRLLRREKPAIVSAGTPKAGLLAMLGARLTGVPVRIYLLRGLRLETVRGLRRVLLATTERLAAACSGSVLCVSPSLRDRLLELGLTTPGKARVLGSGSSNGVDVERFTPAASDEEVAEIRRSLGIDPSEPVVGFVGRLTHDKGIDDLISAFEKMRSELTGLRLLLVGGFEEGDRVGAPSVAHIERDPSVVHAGRVDDPERYYRAMDVLAFPSYREGMPNAPLEAAACGRPTVGYRVTGTLDAVVDTVTGTLVEAGDWRGLGDAILAYLRDAKRAAEHGAAARRRVETEFRHERLRELWRREYCRQLVAAGLRPPVHSADAASPEAGAR